MRIEEASARIPGGEERNTNLKTQQHLLGILARRIFLREAADDEEVVGARVEGCTVLRQVLIEAVGVLHLQMRVAPPGKAAGNEGNAL